MPLAREGNIGYVSLMPFWESPHYADSPSLRAAVAFLGAYAAFTLAYYGWLAFSSMMSPEDGASAAVRIVCSLGLGYFLLKRRKWARTVGLCAGLLGGLGLVAIGMALAGTGVAALPLGLTTAAYAAVSAVCLCLVGIHLARDDAREAFEPLKAGASLAP